MTLDDAQVSAGAVTGCRGVSKEERLRNIHGSRLGLASIKILALPMSTKILRYLLQLSLNV
jgi:hypothetical protein